MIKKSNLFDFDDVLIEPEVLSPIRSRKQVDVHDSLKMLPIFTAPMDTVISEKNSVVFNSEKIYTILPRKMSYTPDDVSMDPKVWVAYGMEDFNELFLKEEKSIPLGGRIYVLIDIANGHMSDLRDMVKQAKKIYGSTLCLMVGNCANPSTYLAMAQAGADYVRMGIGNGAGCLTTVQTGIGYPMASLIYETCKIQKERNLKAKIVADGGFKKYADIIKALALGADYVMLGSIFNKALESAGDTYEGNTKYNSWTEPGEMVDQYSKEIKNEFSIGKKFFKKFRGMSTKEVQKSLGKEKLNTSEGISKIQKVEYTLSGWRENFEDYLKSAMSYTGCYTIGEFIGKVNFNQITKSAFERFNK
jgi:IMP dehydrogenase/GMP reductase